MRFSYKEKKGGHNWNELNLSEVLFMRRIFFLLLVGLVLTTASVAGCEKNQIGTCVTVKAYGLIGWNSVGIIRGR